MAVLSGKKETFQQMIRRKIFVGESVTNCVIHFTVTGRYYNSNKRFSMRTVSYKESCMINLWNGTIWANIDDGTKVLIKRVTN